MNSRARKFIVLVWLLGAFVLGLSAWLWDSRDLLKFGGFLALALLSSTVEIPAPTAGSLPLTFVFVLFGSIDFSLSETVLLGGLPTLLQCVLFRNQRKLDQAIFQVAVAILGAASVSWLRSSAGVSAQMTTWHVPAQLESAVMAASSAVLLFAVSTLPVVVAVWLSERVSFWTTWREISFWTIPYYFAGSLIAMIASFAARVAGWQTVLMAGPVLYLVMRSYRLYITRIENDKKHAEAMSSLHLRTIEALALAIEAKDDTTHDHLARVQIYARELGKELGLTELEQEALRAASILHDIGKLAVPEHIISKPGRLTPEEFEKMKIHPTVGAEILERVAFPYPVAPIVRAHHEKWDGSGYPSGLKGEEIPIGARILAAVDCLDALSTDRQYRRALPLDEAMKIVQKDAGSHFDPKVVEILSKRYVDLEKMAKAEQSPEAAKLSKNVKIERGLAPAAGFEGAAAAGDSAGDFVAKIAAARQEAQALYELSQEMGVSLSLEETLSMVAAKMRKLVPHHGTVVWVRNGSELVPKHASGDDAELFASLKIPFGQGLSGWVAENRKPILNGNPMVESGYLNDPSRCSKLKSAIAVPLENADGVSGVVALYHSGRDAFSKDHLRVLMAASSKLALAVDNALRFEQVESATTLDALTGLANSRTVFVQLDHEISRSRRSNQSTAVIAIDLDNFKQVNNHLGQAEGNRVLKGVAAALRSVCRDYDMVGRVGGDEFTMILPNCWPGELGGKIELIRDVINQVSRETVLGDPLSASIGVAHFPQDGEDAEQILAEAERKMYREKEAHRQRTLVPVKQQTITIPKQFGVTVH